MTMNGDITPLVQRINLLYDYLVDCPTLRPVKHYQENEDTVQIKLGLGSYTRLMQKLELSN